MEELGGAARCHSPGTPGSEALQGVRLSKERGSPSSGGSAPHGLCPHTPWKPLSLTRGKARPWLSALPLAGGSLPPLPVSPLWPHVVLQAKAIYLRCTAQPPCPKGRVGTPSPRQPGGIQRGQAPAPLTFPSASSARANSPRATSQMGTRSGQAPVPQGTAAPTGDTKSLSPGISTPAGSQRGWHSHTPHQHPHRDVPLANPPSPARQCCPPGLSPPGHPGHCHGSQPGPLSLPQPRRAPVCFTRRRL